MQQIEEKPVDYYSNEDNLYAAGENGDSTGSPYGYQTVETVVAPTPDVVVPPEILTAKPLDINPVVITPTPVQPTPVVTTDAKPWYDVIAQLGGTAADIAGALKAQNQLTPTQLAAYQSATGSGGATNKSYIWLWILIAIVLVGVLWYYSTKKTK